MRTVISSLTRCVECKNNAFSSKRRESERRASVSGIDDDYAKTSHLPRMMKMMKSRSRRRSRAVATMRANQGFTGEEEKTVKSGGHVAPFRRRGQRSRRTRMHFGEDVGQEEMSKAWFLDGAV